MNPFTPEKLEKVHYVFPNALNDWSVILEHLKSLDYRGAIVGPPGSGKTTLLRDLEPTLAIATRLQVERLSVDARGGIPPCDLSEDSVLLLDDADRIGFLSSWRYKKLLKGCRRLIITSCSTGKLPTIVHCEVTPEVLFRVISHICEPPPFRAIEEAMTRHKGNGTAAMRELGENYDALMRDRESGIS